MPTETRGIELRNPAGEIVSIETVEVEIAYRILSRFEFLSLFSGDEIDAALALKATTLARFWAFYEAADSFERDHPATTRGLAALVATDVIDTDRRAAILAAWPTT